MMTRKSFIAIFILTLATALPPAGSRASLAQKERVKDAGLKADEAQVNGQCPVTVRFTGYVTATGPGIVKYTFTRSDGATGPVFTLEFKEASTQYVTTSWTLGDASALPTYEGWQAIKILSPNEFESNHETGRFAIACQGAQTTSGKPTPGQTPGGKPAGGSGTPAGERATFRVTLLGFVVNHETRDTLLETDGKRDEVYQVPVVLFFDRDRGLETRSFSVFGPVHGDTNNHPTYIRAGSASERGGLRTGDAFPTARPWEGRTPPAPGFGFPSVLFEGELRPVHNAVLIIPSLWESDSNQELFRPYMDAIERAMPTIGLTVAEILSSPELRPYEFNAKPSEAVGLGTAVTLDERTFDMRDRPIGMVRLVSAPRVFSFQPQVLVMTYEGALAAVTADNGFGPGVVEIRYDEPPDLAGSYSLYFKIERVR